MTDIKKAAEQSEAADVLDTGVRGMGTTSPVKQVRDNLGIRMLHSSHGGREAKVLGSDTLERVDGAQSPRLFTTSRSPVNIIRTPSPHKVMQLNSTKIL